MLKNKNNGFQIKKFNQILNLNKCPLNIVTSNYIKLTLDRLVIVRGLQVVSCETSIS